MSAFLMSESSIQYLVTAAIKTYVIKPDESVKTFALLLRENYRSLAYRYPGDGLTRYKIDKKVKEATKRFENGEIPDADLRVSPVQVVKTARCYQYQSCEHPQWDKSRAKAITDGIISAAVTPILHDLPDYQAAQWD